MAQEASNIVTQLRVTHPRILQLDELTGPRAVSLLSTLINEWLNANKAHTLKSFAKKTSLSTKTVSRIWYKETQSPRFETTIILFKTLGFQAIRLQ